jgi:hypothetical protein
VVELVDTTGLSPVSQTGVRVRVSPGVQHWQVTEWSMVLDC